MGAVLAAEFASFLIWVIMGKMLEDGRGWIDRLTVCM